MLNFSFENDLGPLMVRAPRKDQGWRGRGMESVRKCLSHPQKNGIDSHFDYVVQRGDGSNVRKSYLGRELRAQNTNTLYLRAGGLL